MSPRRYKTDRRMAAKDETRRRIVAATVALHAKHGGAATTYAMIAKEADVAVPTVYNHFPDQAELFRACTGDVMAQAPALGPELFDGIDETEGRLKALVAAVFAAHRFMAPWLRWHEEALFPALAKIMQEARDRLAQLIALALAPRFGQKPPASLIALCDILLDFTAWQRLSEDGAKDDRAAIAAASAALIAICASHDLHTRPSPVTTEPTRRSR